MPLVRFETEDYCEIVTRQVSFRKTAAPKVIEWCGVLFCMEPYMSANGKAYVYRERTILKLPDDPPIPAVKRGDRRQFTVSSKGKNHGG